MRLPFTGKSQLEAKLAEAEAVLKTEKEATVALKSENETLKASVETLKAKIEELSKVPTVAVAEFEAVKKENEELKLQVAKATEEVSDFEGKVTEKAMDVVAAQGIPQLPVVAEDKTKEEIMSQLLALPESQRFAFYQKNEAAIKSEILKSKYSVPAKQ